MLALLLLQIQSLSITFQSLATADRVATDSTSRLISCSKLGVACRHPFGYSFAALAASKIGQRSKRAMVVSHAAACFHSKMCGGAGASAILATGQRVSGSTLSESIQRNLLCQSCHSASIRSQRMVSSKLATKLRCDQESTHLPCIFRYVQVHRV